MKHTIRKALALFMTIALVATTITFTAGNTLQAEEQAPPEISQETTEPAKEKASEPEKSEPVTENQTLNVSQDEPDDEDYEPAPEEDEEMNPANEKKDHDKKDKKIKNLKGSKAGLNVSVTDSSDALPDGASIALTNADSESIQRAIQNYYGSKAVVKDVQAVDISFVKSKGNKIEPNKNVDVTISGIDIYGDNMALFHISGSGADYVKEVSGSSVSFSAGSFSPYAIASYEKKDSDKNDVDDDDEDEDADEDAQNMGISGPKTVYVGETIELRSDKGDYSHEWSSSDSSIATVSGTSKKATVTGVSEGTVTITHSYKKWIYGNIYSEEYKVEVLNRIPATSGTISGDDNVEKYKSISLKLTLEPAGATASYIWYSSDESILTVDKSGNATGVSEGTATITAKVTPSTGVPFEVSKVTVPVS